MAELKKDSVPPVTVVHSYQSISLRKTARRIFEEVEQSPIPITPLELSQNTGIKDSNVRKTLQRLVKKHFIQRICYGLYANWKYNVTLGTSMGRDECGSPRLHCLRLQVGGLSGGCCEWKRDFGVIRVTIQRFGNGSGLVFIDCVGNYSLDYGAFLILLNGLRPDFERWEFRIGG